mmetsp:Transcript_35181/g.48055  ORF Transcript_35181/g.48055 Transcript_35181/m.48055 type:complete len:372 (-) Transcript_35181:42-1157(-)
MTKMKRKVSSTNSRSKKRNSDAVTKSTEPESTNLLAEYLTPSFSSEVHIKRSEFVLRVTLHRIPHQYIEVEVDANQGIHVSTAKYTKKYDLKVPFPSDVKVGSVDQSTSEHDRCGVLTIRVPLSNIGESHLKKHQDIRDKMRQARFLRFQETDEGGMHMRTRLVNLKKQMRSRKPLQNDLEGKDVDSSSVHNDKKHILSHTVQLSNDLPLAGPAEQGTWEFSTATPFNAESSNAEVKTNHADKTSAPLGSRRKEFVVDKEQTIALMNEVNQNTELTREKKVQKMEEMRRKRRELLELRSDRKQKQSNAARDAYQKVIEEKKAHLQKMMNYVKPKAKVQENNPPPTASLSTDTSTTKKKKRVSFRIDNEDTQ